MALINKLDNSASIQYGGSPINSNTVTTLLLLNPTILKAVDKLSASVGDTLTYTITVTNPALSAISSIPFTDVLPAGCDYVTDSFKLNASTVTPTLTGSTLTYTIPTVAALGTAVITFQVKITGGQA